MEILIKRRKTIGIYSKDHRYIQETPQVSSQVIDIKQLAEELAKHMRVEEEKKKEEKIKREISFDESKTMENIANSMLVNRDEKESNMGDMSKNIVEIKSDNKETNNTIDLLSGLDD